jgi:HEAT repeat protein
MSSAIRDLVSMKDVESLVEILNDSDDWMDQIDAAEGLVRLGDRRGLDYLLTAKQSDIDDIGRVAREVLADPEIVRMREQIEAEIRFSSKKLIEQAQGRLKAGKKVYLHKVVYVSAAELLQDDTSGEGFELYAVNDAGLDGWEMVNVVPRRQIIGPGEKAAVGAYVFLKKELGLGDSDELYE